MTQDRGDYRTPMDRVPASHRTMLSEFNWVDEIGHVEVGDETRYFDTFMLSGPTLRKEATDAIDTFRKKTEQALERELCQDFPVLHAGGFPFHKSIHYVTSTLKQLRDEHYLRTDFPMFGGYIAYDEGVDESRVDEIYKTVRMRFEELTKSQNSKIVQINWGFLPHIYNFPNTFYFAPDDEWLVASDQYRNQKAEHPLFFDYNDILLESIEERNPKDSLEFRSPQETESKLETNPTLKDISISFKPGEHTDENGGFDIPIMKLQFELRDSFAIQFMGEVKS